MPAPDLRQAEMQALVSDLLPRGPAWPRDDDAPLQALARAIARRLAAFQAQVVELADRESFPPAATAMLADWERAYGLPDACSMPDPDGLRRRADLLARIAARGGQSRAYFIAVAASLGFTVTITEFRPWRTDVNSCEDPIRGEDWIFVWEVTAPAITIREWAVDVSSCEDPLRAWDTGPLECVLRRLAPARTLLRFRYT